MSLHTIVVKSEVDHNCILYRHWVFMCLYTLTYRRSILCVCYKNYFYSLIQNFTSIRLPRSNEKSRVFNCCLYKMHSFTYIWWQLLGNHLWSWWNFQWWCWLFRILLYSPSHVVWKRSLANKTYDNDDSTKNKQDIWSSVAFTSGFTLKGGFVKWGGSKNKVH